MYQTQPPTDKTIREWYMNSSRVAACALRNEQAVRAHWPGRPALHTQSIYSFFIRSSEQAGIISHYFHNGAGRYLLRGKN